LIVYAPERKAAVTCLKPKPAGGAGKPALDRLLSPSNPAELVGLVNLEHDEAWLLTNEVSKERRQHPERDVRPGRLHLVFSDDSASRPPKGRTMADFEPFKAGS
jgi:hypothetical protein